MRLALLSDIHWETHPDRLARGGQADVLLAPGDMHSDAAKAIERLHDEASAARVLYVLGNHEHSQETFKSAVAKAKAAAKGSRVTVLARDRVDIDGVRFLGATLWSGFSLFGEARKAECMVAARQRLKDFEKIQGRSGFVSPSEIAKEHAKDVAWIRRELAGNSALPKVVLTHFSPTALSVLPARSRDLISAYYANPLEELARGAALWVHGHVHASLDFRLRSANPLWGRIASNSQGFSARVPLSVPTLDGEEVSWETVEENPGFSPDLIFDIDPATGQTQNLLRNV